MEITPSLDAFERLFKNASVVPVWATIPADLETPVSVYAKLQTPTSFLLESVEGGETVGRYSFVGAVPFLILSAKEDRIERHLKQGLRWKTQKWKGEPLEALREELRRYKAESHPELPRFQSGAVGYISYDGVRWMEKLPRRTKDDLKLPDMVFLFCDELIVFDHVSRTMRVILQVRNKGEAPAAAYRRAVARVQATLKKLQKPLRVPNRKRIGRRTVLHSTMDETCYSEKVEQCKKYIAAGDVIQVVLSQRYETTLSVPPFEVYRTLRRLNPSPYMFHFQWKDMALVGSSPEVMVRLENGRATVRPIAGTRRRGLTPEQDAKMEQELLRDAKERAEHLMLVDLGRNDLGRVCTPGSVSVNEFMTVERYSHVMHLVSNVQGKLQEGRDAIDLLKATFPAGTVSGAPKIRAMEIIEELEPVRRGPYAGAVGYFDFSGNFDTGITIRTIVVKGKRATLQAGAGIVADSDPHREYEETVNKATALLSAISLTEEGKVY